MINLTLYANAIKESDSELLSLAYYIDELLRKETRESVIEALGMRPALDKAQRRHEEIKSLYKTMQKVNQCVRL